MNTAANKKFVAMDYVMILLEYLTQEGVDAASVLDEAGLDKQVVSDKERFLSVAECQSLLDKAQTYLHDSVLGLRLGQLQHIAAHGSLGYAILSSKNLADALDKVSRYIRTRNNLTRISYERLENEILLCMDVDSLPVGPLYQFVVEQSFSSFVYVVKSLSGSSNLKLQSRFVYPEPDGSDYYTEVFGEPAVFSSSRNELRFRQEYLADFKLSGDEVFAAIAEQQCERIMAGLEAEAGIVHDVYRILGKSAGNFPSQQDVADQLNMSVRTLVRKLGEEGSRFSDIVQRSKFELAKHYLKNTEWDLEDIACLLEYENAGNFSRSFKRWAGVSPSAFRKSS